MFIIVHVFFYNTFNSEILIIVTFVLWVWGLPCIQIITPNIIIKGFHCLSYVDVFAISKVSLKILSKVQRKSGLNSITNLPTDSLSNHQNFQEISYCPYLCMFCIFSQWIRFFLGIYMSGK